MTDRVWTIGRLGTHQPLVSTSPSILRSYSIAGASRMLNLGNIVLCTSTSRILTRGVRIEFEACAWRYKVHFHNRSASDNSTGTFSFQPTLCSTVCPKLWREGESTFAHSLSANSGRSAPCRLERVPLASDDVGWSRGDCTVSFLHCCDIFYMSDLPDVRLVTGLERVSPTRSGLVIGSVPSQESRGALVRSVYEDYSAADPSALLMSVGLLSCKLKLLRSGATRKQRQTDQRAYLNDGSRWKSTSREQYLPTVLLSNVGPTVQTVVFKGISLL
ncbi:hypothetical protein OE88DRAFT_543209 [Heliocybe sulcata]|uniref:Uncharacterized protein n=1 Tax=Heliocybe sulcata TaxID=5364 RepID=A0A5C3MUV4_9AGAM|nr:hypothetical protein OE88DRAFT_543209 [Heliocybe sulcata]